MRPRILRIITRLNVGGPATHVVLADEGLRSLGWETLLVHGRIEPDEAEIDIGDASIPHRRIESLARPIRPGEDVRALIELVSIVRSYRPDLVHTHLSKAGLLGRTAAMLAAPRAVRVHTFHGTVFADYFGRRASAGIRMIERTLGHRTDAVLALSQRQRQELLMERICHPGQIRVVPLGVDLGRFGGEDRSVARRRLNLDPGDPMVLSIGRLVPIKRLDRLIRAFAEALESVPAARLVVVGDGTERPSLEALVAELGIGPRVRFAGWSTDAPSWYAAADIVALSSDREGTPLAVIEAAASSRPVAATDVGGMADIVEHGVSGFVVPRADQRELSTRIVQLLKDPSLRMRMGLEARTRSEGWSAARLVDDLDATYRELLGRR